MRILPRLIKALQKSPPPSAHIPFSLKPFRQQPKSLYKPVPPLPRSPHVRSKSIILDEVNPITDARAHTRHKSLPPAVRLPKNALTRTNEYDKPREMTEEERTWWSSPYLRLLSSPIRRCLVSNRQLPTAFLVRLAAMRLPADTSGQVKTAIMPDGLQHTKYTVRKAGRATYIHCSRSAVSQLYERERHKRIAWNMVVHPHLADHIAHLLRVRILQELHLLKEQLSAPRFVFPSATARILRQLTRREWKDMNDTGIVPYGDAVALLVAPPVQRDPITKERVEGSLSAAPLPPDQRSHSKPLPPLCLLKRLSKDNGDKSLEESTLPDAKVPLYNGLALFPAPQQRALFHTLLKNIHGADSRICGRENVQKPTNPDDKPSHVFVLCSSDKSLLHGDAVPTAIALWRLRMYEENGTERETSEV